jgi:O-antigen ligase
VTTPSVIPTGMLEKSFSPPHMRGMSVDVLDYVLFLPGIWLTCALGASIRLIGPLFVVAPIGFCLLYAVLRRTVPPRLLSAYFAFCILVAILSKYQLFPASWQVHFMEEAIVRQLIPLLGFFAVAWAAKAYFRRRLLCGDVFFGAPIIIALSFVVTPAVMFQQGQGYQEDYSAYAILSLYGTFINNMAIGYFFILGGVFLTRNWRRYAGLVIVLGVALTSHFIQFRVLTAVVLVTLFGVPGRKVAVGVVVTLVGIYALGINFIPEMMIKSPNDGLRLALVADAFSSTIDTQGVGIGFGKESVRWRYRFPNMPDFTFLPDPRSMTHDSMLEALSRGVHNSFIQALLRTGVLGFFLLVAAFFAAFPPRDLPRDVRNHAANVFAVIFIGCFVDPALESAIQVVGVGFGYGYLLALRAAARAPGPGAILRRCARDIATGGAGWYRSQGALQKIQTFGQSAPPSSLPLLVSRTTVSSDHFEPADQVVL